MSPRLSSDIFFGGTTQKKRQVLPAAFSVKSARGAGEIRLILCKNFFTFTGEIICICPEQPCIRDFSEARLACHR